MNGHEPEGLAEAMRHSYDNDRIEELQKIVAILAVNVVPNILVPNVLKRPCTTADILAWAEKAKAFAEKHLPPGQNES